MEYEVSDILLHRSQQRFGGIYHGSELPSARYPSLCLEAAANTFLVKSGFKPLAMLVQRDWRLLGLFRVTVSALTDSNASPGAPSSYCFTGINCINTESLILISSSMWSGMGSSLDDCKNGTLSRLRRPDSGTHETSKGANDFNMSLRGLHEKA